MPWWIWLVLALFMLGTLIAGGAYVAVHGLRALRVVSAVGGDVSERLGRMGEHDDEADADARPIFTLPLSVASERYADAHAEVIERRERRQERHMSTWRDWAAFNDD